MQEIHFNNVAFANERVAAKKLSTKEEERVIKTINMLIKRCPGLLENSDYKLIQQFVYNYENNAHQAAYSSSRKR